MSMYDESTNTVTSLAYAPGELDRTAPKVIYLQVDTAGDNNDRDEAWTAEMDENVSWSAESIGGTEIVYVRGDLSLPVPAKPEGVVDAMDEQAASNDNQDVTRDVSVQPGHCLHDEQMHAGLVAAVAHPRPTSGGCPCEPRGSDGLHCPDLDGRLLCDPASCAAPPHVHPDDLAVDAFAAEMKGKLAAARAQGRKGWDDVEPGMQQRLSNMLRDHVEKGDPRDVANFAMFLHQRGESILPGEGAAFDLPRPAGVMDQTTVRDAFYDGVLLALQVLNAAGNGGDAHYMELLGCVDHRQLLNRARNEDMIELTGIEKWIDYGIRTRRLPAHSPTGEG